MLTSGQIKRSTKRSPKHRPRHQLLHPRRTRLPTQPNVHSSCNTAGSGDVEAVSGAGEAGVGAEAVGEDV
jgi:hypothetical protein